jgi:hypothetical protein
MRTTPGEGCRMALAFWHHGTKCQISLILNLTNLKAKTNIMTKLFTSLSEIKLFNPCTSGWKNILQAQGKTCADDVEFPLIDCVEYNGISDTLWLIGKRKIEIQIAVKFAKMCADSVQKYADAVNAANSAAEAAADAANAANYAANSAAATNAVNAANYANAAVNAVNAVNYANANSNQKELNKSFLVQCIQNYENEN